MKLSMDEFQGLASHYADLYQSSFDADSATLRNVELYPLGQRRTEKREQTESMVTAQAWNLSASESVFADLKPYSYDYYKRTEHEQSLCRFFNF